ncbi:hypothetical protein D3C75_1119780 [compost metagenome]
MPARYAQEITGHQQIRPDKLIRLNFIPQLHIGIQELPYAAHSGYPRMQGGQGISLHPFLQHAPAQPRIQQMMKRKIQQPFAG